MRLANIVGGRKMTSVLVLLRGFSNLEGGREGLLTKYLHVTSPAWNSFRFRRILSSLRFFTFDLWNQCILRRVFCFVLSRIVLLCEAITVWPPSALFPIVSQPSSVRVRLMESHGNDARPRDQPLPWKEIRNGRLGCDWDWDCDWDWT
jgi:hypothetical protein